MRLYESIVKNLKEAEDNVDIDHDREKYVQLLSKYLKPFKLSCEITDETHRFDCIIGIKIIDDISGGCISYGNATIPCNWIQQAQSDIESSAGLIADDIVEYRYTHKTGESLSMFRNERNKLQQNQAAKIEKALKSFVKEAKSVWKNR